MRVSRDLINAIVAHARADAPNECCGLIGGRDDTPVSTRRAENLFASPTRFEVGDLPRLLREIEESGEDLLGMYHSHPRSEAYPSQTDVNLAWGWPGTTWFICSLMDSEPAVRAFVIEDAQVDEIDLEIE